LATPEAGEPPISGAAASYTKVARNRPPVRASAAGGIGVPFGELSWANVPSAVTA
jgi:hypothetical protein